jgi:peptidoglycan/xylan/chitin deacetylase (PgdA/CDA1 family)
MLRGKSPLGLLLAGAAAFAYYRYSKMSPEQRKGMVDNLKERGKKIFGQFIPTSKEQPATMNGSQYTG